MALGFFSVDVFVIFNIIHLTHISVPDQTRVNAIKIKFEKEWIL